MDEFQPGFHLRLARYTPAWAQIYHTVLICFHAEVAICEEYWVSCICVNASWYCCASVRLLVVVGVLGAMLVVRGVAWARRGPASLQADWYMWVAYKRRLHRSSACQTSWLLSERQSFWSRKRFLSGLWLKSS